MREIRIREEKGKSPAGNGRFGASGGVARPTVCGENQQLCLVASAVNPPPASSRLDVTCNGGQRIAKLKRMEKRDTETANIDTKSANNDKKSVIVDTKSAGNGTRSTDNGTQIANNGIQSTNNGTQTANNGIKRQNDGTPTFSFCNKNKTFGISRFINSK